MWLKTITGDLVALRWISHLQAVEGGGMWRNRASLGGTTVNVTLDGEYSTQAEAQDAAASMIDLIGD